MLKSIYDLIMKDLVDIKKNANVDFIDSLNFIHRVSFNGESLLILDKINNLIILFKNDALMIMQNANINIKNNFMLIPFDLGENFKVEVEHIKREIYNINFNICKLNENDVNTIKINALHNSNKENIYIRNIHNSAFVFSNIRELVNKLIDEYKTLPDTFYRKNIESDFRIEYSELSNVINKC